jgi:hypothetical protein
VPGSGVTPPVVDGDPELDGDELPPVPVPDELDGLPAGVVDPDGAAPDAPDPADG